MILTNHVVPVTYTASYITDGLTRTTVPGEALVFSVDGDVVKRTIPL